MAFFSSLDQIGGFASSSSIAQEFRAGFLKLVLGTISLPINFPTTNYHRGFQGRKNIVKLLRKIIEDRRGSKEIQQDMLGFMMNEEAKKDTN
uniref:Putative ovule protein n=1 Tax=Solanum chacoense TaxID=4108 RepID=A0A0V0GNV2_SOLCH